MSTILIKQLPDDYADAMGLSKYNRSRMPGTFDRFSAGINEDGRYATNLDEESITVAPEKKEEIKALRESLAKKINRDISGTSDFWKEFTVLIYSDKPKIFNTEIPQDIISYNMLVANKYIAPSKEAAETPEYKDSQYYAYTEEGEVSEEVNNRKLRDRAVVELLNISENKEKMLLYGQYLEGLKYSDKLKENDLYKLLRAYIEDKNIKNTVNFLSALKEPIEKLQVKAIIDRSIKQHLITRSNAGKKAQVYQYGKVTLGTSLEEVYQNLCLPDFAPELLSLKNIIETKQ
jgi:hypothetical protein